VGRPYDHGGRNTRSSKERSSKEPSLLPRSLRQQRVTNRKHFGEGRCSSPALHYGCIGAHALVSKKADFILHIYLSQHIAITCDPRERTEKSKTNTFSDFRHSERLEKPLNIIIMKSKFLIRSHSSPKTNRIRT